MAVGAWRTKHMQLKLYNSRTVVIWEAIGWIAGGRGYFGRFYLHFPIRNTHQNRRNFEWEASQNTLNTSTRGGLYLLFARYLKWSQLRHPKHRLLKVEVLLSFLGVFGENCGYFHSILYPVLVSLYVCTVHVWYPGTGYSKYPVSHSRANIL